MTGAPLSFIFKHKGENTMLKKTITYTDYNGVERTEDFYFNLSKGEIIEMELTTEGGYIEMINKITAAQDHITLFKIFKELNYKFVEVDIDDVKETNNLINELIN